MAQGEVAGEVAGAGDELVTAERSRQRSKITTPAGDIGGARHPAYSPRVEWCAGPGPAAIRSFSISPAGGGPYKRYAAGHLAPAYSASR